MIILFIWYYLWLGIALSSHFLTRHKKDTCSPVHVLKGSANIFFFNALNIVTFEQSYAHHMYIICIHFWKGKVSTYFRGKKGHGWSLIQKISILNKSKKVVPELIYLDFRLFSNIWCQKSIIWLISFPKMCTLMYFPLYWFKSYSTQYMLNTTLYCLLDGVGQYHKWTCE